MILKMTLKVYVGVESIPVHNTMKELEQNIIKNLTTNLENLNVDDAIITKIEQV